mmetsp:Transcript_16029/g.28971  ORF Transcript_16029/g.28971 Transcript_16029/m.28971 type:complete len:89 (-) Transcript_16029:134-400(-)
MGPPKKERNIPNVHCARNASIATPLDMTLIAIGPSIARPTIPMLMVLSRPMRSDSMPVSGSGMMIPNSKATAFIQKPCSIGGSINTSM